MKFKKNIVIFLVMFVLGGVLFQQPVFGESTGKMELQKKTFEVLDQLDRIILGSKSLNALFTDQSKETLDMYEAQFCLTYTVVENMNELQKRWEKRIKKDRNDKVFRVFAATVQLAMYSIYSRPERYMGFMKVFKKTDREVKCFGFLQNFYEEISLRDKSDFGVFRVMADASQAFVQPNPAHLSNLVKEMDVDVRRRRGEQVDSDLNVLTYRDRADDWEIKAASILEKAKGNIQKALGLDPYYADAQILEVQALVLEGKYQEARDRFARLEAMELFKEKRSLLNSWQAYMQLIEGRQEMGETFLRKASAYSEPGINSEWALEYLKLFKWAQTKWVVFNFHDFDLLKDGNLEELRKKSFESINLILTEMEKPISELPKCVDDRTLEQLTKGESNIYYSLESDTSNRNLEKFATLFETLYLHGRELLKSFKKWDQLAKKNDRDVAYFYLLNKSNCAIVLLHMLKNTIELLENDLLCSKLAERQQIKRSRRKIDYRSYWKQWLNLVNDSLFSDIEVLRTVKKDSVYFHILDFEYQAFFGDADLALSKLENLVRLCDKQNRRYLQVQPSCNKITVRSFVISWKSFLFLKKGDYCAAEDVFEEVEDWTLLEQWKEHQENLIYIKSAPIQPSLSTINFPQATIDLDILFKEQVK